jgi:N-formylglutamate amidohydrolase
MKSPVVAHIPHASAVVPHADRAHILLDDSALDAELLRMTDAYTDQLFAGNAGADVIFLVSRLVVDAERFPDDAQEPMAAGGMGVVYSKT